MTCSIAVAAGEVVTQIFLVSEVGWMEIASAEASMHLIALATTGSIVIPEGIV